ncbi:SMR family transporter [Arcicella sp. LKC2W]|uniref:DMT family transporter n=1 Tax=Arcicella sp. LKC2W TaxID=2984198 RepID=UPI002B1F6361|nr:SMR family transporter [Arcicella sp. LKC2W]MEA5460932.1 SMR family transporter [Arcicella sp. LKC2W]
MAWFYLILAAGLEACWMFSLKFLSFTKFKILNFQNFTKSEGLTIWLPLAGYIIFGITNTYFFSLAMKNIPTAIAFTIWTAISILFIKMVEVIFLHGKISLPEIGFLVLILIGIVGLKMVSKT